MRAGAALWLLAFVFSACAADEAGIARFREKVEPLLVEYCYGCHADGMKQGSVAFDGYDSEKALVEDRDLWLRVLKIVRAEMMPPLDAPRPSPAEIQNLVTWIKYDALANDPQNPDPGRVTIRRLNRTEYANTIRDLLGYDYKTDEEFPPDDSGYGFDNIGDVLSVSPLLLEKYMQAAERIVAGVTAKDGFRRYFSRKNPPGDAAARREYAAQVLRSFATRAFRRPVDDELLDRLVTLAESSSGAEGGRFETGISRAFVAILSSPRFLFRVEQTLPAAPGDRSAVLDDYALASRLSYFLWSTMPDDELLELAAKCELRERIEPQVRRMLADDRARAFAENFVGQWLQVRDIESVAIDVRAVLAREGVRTDSPVLGGDIRRSMRQETELCFAYVLREDRSVLELLDSDYTFLDEKLARHYGIEGVEGRKMRKVELPAEGPGGGVLTHAAILTITSNPTRTSPVKRGLFVLDNLLGCPPPPPPPDIPELEAAGRKLGREPTVRELLELHRQQALCKSCHARMDPLGLALENFNAVGMWRDKEHGQKIVAQGELLTGERFDSVRELKRVLTHERRFDYYRCLSEKLLTYALGRGLEYYDVDTVDKIVERVEREQGRMSAVLLGIVESAPFQKCRLARP